MSRPLKFRIWDGKEMRLLDQQFVGVGQIGFSDTHWVDLNEHDAEDFQVMQFTGLKDKNGLEIYEGDRLEYLIDPHDPDGPTDRYTVEWRGNGFVGVWDGDKEAKNSGNDGLIDAYLDIAVIGNIYENPELLEHQS